MDSLLESEVAQRTYKIKWLWRAFAIGWTAFSVLFWEQMLSDELLGRRDPTWWHFFVGPTWMIGGLFWTAHMFLARVTLFADSIETSGLLGRARLRFDEILGRREHEVDAGGEGGSTRYLKIEPNGDHLPTLDFMKDYDFDSRFYDWFEHLRDLDSEEKLRRKNSSG